jgi:DNA-directed RNA polymerase specialized sigma24 family protein
MVPRKVLTKEQIENIIERYNNKEPLLSIGKVFGVGQGVITRILKENGATIRKRSESLKAFTEEQEEEVIEKYKKGMTAKEIASQYGLSDPPVLKVLKRAGYDPYKDNQERKKKLSAGQKEEIAKAYKKGETAQQLAKKYGVTDPTIKKALLEMAIDVRSYSEAQGGLKDAEIEELIDLYKEGWNTVRLAEKYGIGDGTVGRYLDRAGVQKRTWSEARGGLSDEQKREVVKKYLNGETSVDIAKEYNVYYSTILRAVKESGNEIRTLSESKIMKVERQLDTDDIIGRYIGGESALSIAIDYPVTDAGIRSLLVRRGVEIRDKGTWGDSIRNILDGTGNYCNQRETEYYIFTLNGFPGILKPGIAHDSEKRKSVSSGYYGNPILVQGYKTREEAYLLEQVILDQTSQHSVRPQELENINWEGIGELSFIEEDSMISIFEFFNSELEELGVWEFASAYVPMTEAERQECLKRSRSEKRCRGGHRASDHPDC